jgi:predicted DsbA family dithiol-disulfide isomerase
MKVEIYSDVVCPWCYIGERRFFRALEAYGGGADLEVVFRPYQLDPQAPEVASPLKEYLQSRFGAGAGGMLARVSEAAAGEGITIDWESAQSVNTRTAHRLVGLAAREYELEVQRAVAEGLFDLHFGRGGDLSDLASLVEVGGSVGMDRERVREYLSSDAGRDEVETEIEAARQLGIQAVPTFVFDGQYAVQGAQPVSAFLRALEEMDARSSEAAGSAAGSCEDGACGTGSGAA